MAGAILPELVVPAASANNFVKAAAVSELAGVDGVGPAFVKAGVAVAKFVQTAPAPDALPASESDKAAIRPNNRLKGGKNGAQGNALGESAPFNAKP